MHVAFTSRPKASLVRSTWNRTLSNVEGQGRHRDRLQEVKVPSPSQSKATIELSPIQLRSLIKILACCPDRKMVLIMAHDCQCRIHIEVIQQNGEFELAIVRAWCHFLTDFVFLQTIKSNTSTSFETFQHVFRPISAPLTCSDHVHVDAGNEKASSVATKKSKSFVQQTTARFQVRASYFHRSA